MNFLFFIARLKRSKIYWSCQSHHRTRTPHSLSISFFVLLWYILPQIGNGVIHFRSFLQDCKTIIRMEMAQLIITWCVATLCQVYFYSFNCVLKFTSMHTINESICTICPRIYVNQINFHVPASIFPPFDVVRLDKIRNERWYWHFHVLWLNFTIANTIDCTWNSVLYFLKWRAIKFNGKQLKLNIFSN